MTKSPPQQNSWLTAIFLAVIAMYIWVLPVGGTAALRNTLMVTMIVLTAVALIKRQASAYFPAPEAWLAYLAIATSTLWYALDRAYSMQEIRVEILYPAAVFFIAATMIQSVRSWMQLATVLSVGNMALAGYSVFVGMTGGTTKDGLVGSFNSGVGSYSTYIVTTLPVVAALYWHNWRRGKHWQAFGLGLGIALNLLALYFVMNRQSTVALLVEVFVVGAFGFKRGVSVRHLLISLLVVVVLGFLFAVQFIHRTSGADDANAVSAIHQQTQQDVRWPVWKRVVWDVAENPLKGAGFGLRSFNLKYEGKVQFNGPFWHAHNMVLNKAVQMGVPGAIAFLILFWVMPWKARVGLEIGDAEEIIALCGIALGCGVFLKNMTDDFFTRDCALLYWLLAGAILGSLRHCKEAKPQ